MKTIATAKELRPSDRIHGITSALGEAYFKCDAIADTDAPEFTDDMIADEQALRHAALESSLKGLVGVN